MYISHGVWTMSFITNDHYCTMSWATHSLHITKIYFNFVLKASSAMRRPK
jgi:hypothetical protein